MVCLHKPAKHSSPTVCRGALLSGLLQAPAFTFLSLDLWFPECRQVKEPLQVQLCNVRAQGRLAPQAEWRRVS